MQTFFANTDGETSVTKTFDPPIVASSIAILPTKIKGKQPCMKLSLQGCDFGMHFDLTNLLSSPLMKVKPAPRFSNNGLVGDIKYIHVQRTKETEQCEK